MQKGLKIEFTEEGPRIVTSESVEGIVALDQNLIINIAVQEGSDKFFPERGNQLIARFLQYGYVSQMDAQHQSNFAAIGAKIFYRTHRHPLSPDMDTIKLEAGVRSNNRLRLRLQTQYKNNEETESVVAL